MYSYDNKGASPGVKGRAVGLDALVDQAEQKFNSKMTEKMVKSEYEVLDEQGETTVLSKGKKKGSPKQKAVKSDSSLIWGADGVEDVDGFEFIERLE